MPNKRPSKRWGRGYKDDRDWRIYNEQLVVRGEFYLEFGFVKSWNKELRMMNHGKRGGQYLFPESFIKWQAVWKQWVDYRGLEGIARSLAKYGLIPNYADYTTTWNRVHDMIPEIKLPTEDELEVATDGSGLKTGNAGEYRIFKYKEKTKKKYLVVVITADVKKKKLLKVEAYIQKKGKSEPKTAKRHLKKLKKAGKKIKKLYGDGAMDSNDLFRYLDREEIGSAIKLKKNASTDYCRGSKKRREEIRILRKLGYKLWAYRKRYGKRWAVEGIFSAVKRKFGECIHAIYEKTMRAEAIQRFWSYDLLKDHGIESTGIM